MAHKKGNGFVIYDDGEEAINKLLKKRENAYPGQMNYSTYSGNNV